MTASPPLYSDSELMLRDARDATNDFHARVRALGIALSAVPSVSIDSESGLLYYEHDRREVIIPFWPDLSPQARDLYAMIAGPERSPGEGFAWINWFYLAHELAHQVLAESPAAAAFTRYENERAASAWALGFWNARGERDRLSFMSELTAEATLRFASFERAPAGADHMAYFNDNYEALLQDPPAYALYQLRMLQEVFAEMPNATLDGMARALSTPQRARR